MDAVIDSPHGPRWIQANGNVSVPRELLGELGLRLGGHVHFMLNPDMPGTLIIIPSEQIARFLPQLLEHLRRDAR